MAKQTTIKEIAKLAGVSVGTVDRIIHNRGKVSARNEEKVRAALEQANYKTDIHTTAKSLTKSFSITVCIPYLNAGGYWEDIHGGILSAMEEFSDLNINCRIQTYNQFDVESCRKEYALICPQKPDAVIIGSIFEKETEKLCRQLDEAGIPYVLVDSTVKNSHPLASFFIDNIAAGRLLGQLISMLCPEESEYAVFNSFRRGGQESHNTLERHEGLMQYMQEHGLENKVKDCFVSLNNYAECLEVIEPFMKANPGIKGALVLNSRGNNAAEVLEKIGKGDVKLISFDITTTNVQCLESGSMTAIIYQRPYEQALNAVKCILNYLLYGKVEPSTSVVPADVVFKENIKSYNKKHLK